MHRRWIWPTVLFVVVVGVGAAAILRPEVRESFGDVADVVAGWSTRLRDLAATLPETETEERSLGGESASVLLIVGEPGAAAFALVSTGPTGPPSVIVLPQDMLVSIPGFGEYRLADAMLFEGPDLVSLSVTNQFGIRIDRMAVLGPGSVAAAFTAPVAVDLAAPFFVEDGRSIVRQLPAGESQVAPDLLEELLVVEGAGDAFEWIQRQGAAWRAILGAVEAEPRVADRLLASVGGDAADLLVTVAGAEDAVVATVPVERADDGGSRDALSTVNDRVDGFVAQRLGHLLLRPEGRPRIEILNGNGRIGSTRLVADILIRNGYWLIRTDNADTFDHTDTLVIAQGEASEATAREIVELLGHGLLYLEVRAPSGIIDVSIIVGTDVPTGEG
ncbi:MAG TPA: LytR C-terminal domain-containing protein [Acidimicrobiia bacterium]|nr:LytR C-terminal domain-containing protein [Acidimicrobiia bacterium]